MSLDILYHHETDPLVCRRKSLGLDKIWHSELISQTNKQVPEAERESLDGLLENGEIGVPFYNPHPDGSGDSPLSANFSQLESAINRGQISFCKTCTIYIYACCQTTKTAKKLANVTGCNVIYGTELTYPPDGGKNPSNRWTNGGQWMSTDKGVMPGEGKLEHTINIPTLK